MGKRSPAPPPAPDYATLAVKQGEANLAAAKQSAYMSNPNIYGPTGSQEVTWTKTPTVDTDAYNKAMENWRQQTMNRPEAYIPEPTQEQFTTFIEQPTIRQTINPDAEAALRQQELAQFYMSRAAAGAASGLGDLGIASAFRPTGIPDLVYGAIGPYDAISRPTNITNWGQAQALQQGAGGEIQGPPTGAYTPMGGYGIEALPGQVTAGQQAAANVPVQGAIMAPGSQYYGVAGAGPAAPTDLGQLQAGQFTAQGAPSGQAFGTAQGGPSSPQLQGLNLAGVGGVGQGVNIGDFGFAGGGPNAGLFGLAGGGPAGVQLGGLDTSNLMGIQGGVGQFGQAQGGTVEGPQLGRLNTFGVGRVQRAPSQGEFGYAQQFVEGPELQGQIDVSSLAAAPIQAGTTAQQAIMSRLQPQLMAERQQLQTQLINQGLRPGGEAFNAALAAQAQKENDLMLQAAAQGIALDQAARQQGFAEQQSRAMFANQAAMQGFGAGMEQAGLYNVGLGQNVQQALATQAAANQAQQQAFGQRLAGAEFGRESELARFGAGMQTEQARNQAIAQNTQMALQSGQFANEAQAQQFAQRLAAGEFGREAQLASFQTGQQAQQAINQAIAQNFAQAQAAQELQNQAIQQNLQGALTAEEAQRAAQAQRFGQAMGATELGAQLAGQQFGMGQEAAQAQNQAIAQNFQQALQAQQAQNAALAQNYQQALGAGQFNREALLQQFGMGQSAQELANQAIAQNYQQSLAQTEAQNQALQQIFGQGVTQQELQNAAAAQNFQQQLAAQQANLARQAQQAGQSQEAAQFYNQAQAQAYQQDLARQAAANAAQQQRFGQQMDIQAAQNAALAQRQQTELDYFNTLNAVQQQQYNQALAQAEFRNTAAQQALAQQAAMRSMPVNEISALLSGGQVSVPQFQGYSGVTVAPPPIFQAGQAAGNFAQQNYANQVGAYNAQMGLLGGLAGGIGAAAAGPAGLSGFFTGSDRRLKSNIVRVGTHPLGIGVYEYDIAGQRQRGVMADEVETVLPEAVVTRSDGYKMVNYGLL